ncbi:DNA gyrase subunit A, partial [Candidatus Uhrbacteria bacterium]|nr:DNA gyrase subunit A [Candidatus Uhrbacteria bacterium]
PEATRTAKGQALVNFLNLGQGEDVTSVLSLDEMDGIKYLMMVTKLGTIKKTELKDLVNVRSNGLIAIKLKGGDRLEWVKPSSGKDDVMLVTKNGMSIRFNEKHVRAMGRVAAGVRGIKMKGDDTIVGMAVVSSPLITKGRAELLVIMQNGYGKRTSVKEYKDQNRGGSGVKTANITTKTGPIVGMRVINNEDLGDILIMSEQGQVIRTKMKTVSVLGRATQGVRIMRFKKDGDSVASIALLSENIES